MGFRHVTILGGGLCGLMTAWKLQEAGIQTLVLEAQAEVGGLAKSLTWQGFRFDVGPHHYMARDPLLLDEIKSLMGGSYQVPLRQARVWFQDRWIAYPLTTRSLVDIPFPTLLQATVEYFSLQAQSYLGWSEEEKKDVGKEGKESYTGLLDQLLMQESLDQRWQRPSAYVPSWMTQQTEKKTEPMARLAQLLRRAFEAPTPYLQSLHFPSEGIGSIAKRLRARIQERGGRVLTNARVQRVLVPEGELRAVVFDDGTQLQQVETDYLFSTIPLRSLLHLLEPLPPHRLLAHLGDLSHQAVLVLNLLLEETTPQTQHWYYFPSQDTPFFRASYALPLPERREGSEKLACLSVECLLHADDPLLRAPAETLLQRCLPALEKAKLLKSPFIRDIAIHRESFALPLSAQQHEEGLRHIQAFLTGTRRLRAIGMHSAFRPWSLEQTFRDALRAARSLLDETSSRRLQRTEKS